MNAFQYCIRVLLLCFVVSAVSIIISCTSTAGTVNVNSNGYAIKGYDTVAYFTKGGPVKGTQQFTYTWNGAKWLFSSREHMELFTADPEKYAPQYGGY